MRASRCSTDFHIGLVCGLCVYRDFQARPIAKSLGISLFHFIKLLILKLKRPSCSFREVPLTNLLLLFMEIKYEAPTTQGEKLFNLWIVFYQCIPRKMNREKHQPQPLNTTLPTLFCGCDNDNQSSSVPHCIINFSSIYYSYLQHSRVSKRQKHEVGSCVQLEKIIC